MYRFIWRWPFLLACLSSYVFLQSCNNNWWRCLQSAMSMLKHMHEFHNEQSHRIPATRFEQILAIVVSRFTINIIVIVATLPRFLATRWNSSLLICKYICIYRGIYEVVLLRHAGNIDWLKLKTIYIFFRNISRHFWYIYLILIYAHSVVSSV